MKGKEDGERGDSTELSLNKERSEKKESGCVRSGMGTLKLRKFNLVPRPLLFIQWDLGRQ